MNTKSGNIFIKVWVLSLQSLHILIWALSLLFKLSKNIDVLCKKVNAFLKETILKIQKLTQVIYLYLFALY